MTTAQSLTGTDVARALIDLLPAGRDAAADDLRCGDAYGSAVMSLGDLAATGRKIPLEMVEQINRIWPNEGQDLDDLLHARLAQVTPNDSGPVEVG